MTYIKPKDITYTQMAIYIDEHIYNDNKDEQKLFEYMYHLYYILAVKKCYFNESKEYDGYALYSATQLFLRYINPKQFIEGPKQLKKIKSSLNYIKSTLYSMKVDYQKETFREVYDPKYYQKEDSIGLELINRGLNTFNQISRIEFEYCLSQIEGNIKEEINSTPYRKDKIISKNLYISCSLSLIKGLEDKNNKDVVIYHLDKSMRNYVDLLCTKIKKSLAKDLLYLMECNKPSDSLIKDILESPIKKEIDTEEYGY